MILGQFLLLNSADYFLQKMNEKITCFSRIKSPKTRTELIPRNTEQNTDQLNTEQNTL